jgi:hypothetical protein
MRLDGALCEGFKKRLKDGDRAFAMPQHRRNIDRAESFFIASSSEYAGKLRRTVGPSPGMAWIALDGAGGES